MVGTQIYIYFDENQKKNLKKVEPVGNGFQLNTNLDWSKNFQMFTTIILFSFYLFNRPGVAGAVLQTSS